MDLQELFERFGVAIVFVNALLHELAVPIPLTPTVLVAGAAHEEVLAIAAIVAAVVIGSVIGNAVWFAAGRRYGAAVLGHLCRFSISPDTCVARSGAGFERWGGAFFLVGRFVPGVSLVAPPIAGALGMSWPKFLALTALGAALWAGIVILIGVAFRPVLVLLSQWLAAVPAGAWLAAAIVIAGTIAWRLRARRRAGQALEVPRIRVDELRVALQSETPPVVIDVRGAAMRQVEGQRIPGALTLSLEALESELLPARPLVLYCNCPNEASAAAGVRILKARGYADSRALQGGLAAWIAARYAVCRTDVSADTPAPAAVDGTPQLPRTLGP